MIPIIQYFIITLGYFGLKYQILIFSKYTGVLNNIVNNIRIYFETYNNFSKMMNGNINFASNSFSSNN